MSSVRRPRRLWHEGITEKRHIADRLRFRRGGRSAWCASHDTDDPDREHEIRADVEEDHPGDLSQR